jgi:hypothetical protein
MKRRRTALELPVPVLVLAGWLAMLVFPADATETDALDPALAALGWAELAIPGKTPAIYRLTDDGDLEARSKAGVSILYRSLTPNERNGRVLTWRWRVDEAVPATDPADAGKDDRDLAIHIWFPDDEEPGFWKRLKRTFAKVLGIPPVGKALTYVFGGTGERHRRLVNPHHEPGGILVVLRPTGTEIGKWFDERIDFVSDFEQAFGKAPPKPIYLAVSTDSDDTGTRAVGRIAELTFHEK